MKTLNKVISALLLVVMLAALTSPALTAPAFAAGASSAKEEVIYIVADANGVTQSVDVVNIFGSGDITDYGDYSAVKMLTTNDTITQSGDMITFSTAANTVYYQGTMKNVEIPWLISFRYFIDGKAYSAQDIAGKSGKLEIQFTVSKNAMCKGSFFDDYALQASFTLNTDLCSNINAPGASVANVGKNKQLTYTIFPGKGIDTVIFADVNDFEMDAVSINGIKLRLNIEVDDTELMDKIAELIDGITKANDGAIALQDGAAALKDGSSELTDGARSLKEGAVTLDEGVVKLQSGIKTAQNGLNALNAQSATLVNGSAEVKIALQTIGSSLAEVSVATDKLEQLTAASGSIKIGIGNLHDGISKLQRSISYTQYKNLMGQNGLDIEALKAGNTQAISEITAQLSGLRDMLSNIKGVSGYEEQVVLLEAQIQQLQNIVTLLTGNNAAIEGTDSYLNGLTDAVKELYVGVVELKEKYETFDTAIAAFANTLAGTINNLSKLSSGINTLITKYTALDIGIREYTDGVAQLVVGYGEIVDGVAALAQGSKELQRGSNDLYSGSAELYDGVVTLYNGAAELADGMREMHEKTFNFDTQADSKIDDILASMQGNENETVSFVSTKNTNVDAVQFVIKTSAIEKAETENIVAQHEEVLSLWQKFLRLFGLY